MPWEGSSRWPLRNSRFRLTGSPPGSVRRPRPADLRRRAAHRRVPPLGPRGRRGCAPVPRALPRHGDRPPARCRGDGPPAPGRARALGAAARPGGRAGRLGPRAACRRLRLHQLPRTRRRLLPRRGPRGHAAHGAGAACRGGTPLATTSPRRPSSSGPRRCTPPATRRAHPRRSQERRHHLLRRRRHERG